MTKILKNMLKSIKVEINLYPCMGLVSKKNNGCHKDMNYKTFMISYKVLKKYFIHITKNINLINNFCDLRNIGIHYENLMFKNTNNINTHKGLLFASGIFLFCYLKNIEKSKIKLINYIQNFTYPLNNVEYKKLNTPGAKLFYKYKIEGARQVALNGYKKVFEIYEYYLKKISTKKISTKYKLFFLLLKCTNEIDDTTLINKIGLNKYYKVKEKIDSILKLLDTPLQYTNLKNRINSFNNFCINNNVSPGGAADIFVLAYFLIKEKY